MFANAFPACRQGVLVDDVNYNGVYVDVDGTVYTAGVESLRHCCFILYRMRGELHYLSPGSWWPSGYLADADALVLFLLAAHRQSNEME